jgi:hypothetical protein
VLDLHVLVTAMFAGLIGAAFCFLGYRVFLVLLPVWGFFAGFWIGAQAIALVFGEGFLATTTGWVVGFIVGLVLAVLSYWFYLMGVALVAGVVGYALGTGLLAWLGMSDTGVMTILAGVIVGIVVAGLTVVLNLQKPVIMVVTSVVGANALLLAVLLPLEKVDLDQIASAGDAIQPVLQDSTGWFVAWLAVAAVGFIVQWRSSRLFNFRKETYVELWG